MGHGRSNGTVLDHALASRSFVPGVLAAEPKRGRFHAVIETPKGSRDKSTFVPELGMFESGNGAVGRGVPRRISEPLAHAVNARGMGDAPHLA